MERRAQRRALLNVESDDETGEDEEEHQKLDLSKFSASQLKQYLSKLFQIGDTDGSGTLDRKELKGLLAWSGFDFAVTDVDDILLKCDKDGDGLISYDEFVSLATEHCTIDRRTADKITRAAL